MADKKRPNFDDKAAQNDAPMKDPPIEVEVKPKGNNLPKKGDPQRDIVERQNQVNRDTAKKVGKQLEKDVREAVKKAAPDGKQAQLDAAKQAGSDAAKQVNPNEIKEIKVNVAGNESTHVPSEGTPPPAPEPKK